jgi:hypothetical protein
MRRARWVLVVLALLGVLAWWGHEGAGRNEGAETLPETDRVLPKGEPVRVLFIGNSLTATNDVPALVQAMASSGGVKVECEACTLPGASLEDHWNDGTGRRLLAGGKWHFVVLQQGPSSLPQSQVHLRQWSTRWARAARQRGARPALYMVWPMEGQKNGFELVARSYRSAARASGSLLLGAGDAWRDVSRDAGAPALYLPDRLHPTPAGSYLAALVITQRLTGVKAGTIPPKLTLPGGRVLELPAEQARRLQQAAEKVVELEAKTQGKSKPSG